MAAVGSGKKKKIKTCVVKIIVHETPPQNGFDHRGTLKYPLKRVIFISFHSTQKWNRLLSRVAFSDSLESFMIC